ncbi:MAG: hypothetical protein KDD22_06875 [Bdellovibrionales bacterium]|nr:hypothetical protein [Bdellovibrionales bacterium]
MQRMQWWQGPTHDFGYKALALAVALVIWVTMLGRKDITMVRKIPVQYLSEARFEVGDEGKLAEVEVEVMGSRMSLKKFAQSDQTLSLDLTELRPGTHTVRLRKESISVPVGARVVSIRPEQVNVTIKPSMEEGKK